MDISWSFTGFIAGNLPRFSAWIAHLWIWVTLIGYVLSVMGLFVIIYATVRLFELRKREHIYFTTLIGVKKDGVNPRWQHIEMLSGSKIESEWKEAVIEADIMLDEVLEQQGFEGDGVGEKLKAADPAEFRTLQDAWEAHKVRNQIAHEGSAFKLSDTITQRTITHFKNVFQEFKAI